MNKKADIILFEAKDGSVKLSVPVEQETVWLSASQMADLFGRDYKTVRRHIGNILKEEELDPSVVAFFATTAADGKTYQVEHYNLDMIISVGYRIKSKRGIEFRRWANSVLKDYILKGYAINQKRLSSLDAEKLKNVETMMTVVRRLIARQALDVGEANGILEVISKYSTSFKMLKEYDDGYIDLSSLNQSSSRTKILSLATCERLIGELKKSTGSGELFGKPRGGSFEGSLNAIYQSFEGEDLYKTISEKAANLLYLVIKDHPFYDGNKRIGALLFIVFLTINNYHLTENGETKISDRALTAVALLIAESNPEEKPLIVSLVVKLLED